MNYYKRHIGDYASKAGHLSPLEHGVYTLLLDAYYSREEAPTRAEAIRFARARSTDEVAAVDAVLAEFFTEVDGRFVQSRVEEELQAFRQRQETNRQLGAKGGQAKSKRIASESLSEAEANDKPSHKPLTTSQEDQKQKQPRVTAQPAPDDVDPQTWGDWLALRKAKRAPITETAIAGIRREAAKAGMSLAEALAMCCERGWSGFKADWVGAQAAATKAQLPGGGRREL